MGESRIRLSPIEGPQPDPTYIPVVRAWRWWSPFEENFCLEPNVSVFVTQRAYVRFCAHAGSDLYNEVGGWLVGKWCVDKNSQEQFVVVETVIPAMHTRYGSAHLTFTQDSLVEMQRLLEDQYPGKLLVGWFHTHPRMGVFLSEMDVWLHNHFFPEPWQVALVIEPHSFSGGFFVRQMSGWMDPRQYFGFYELTNFGDRSVIHWQNLKADFDIVTSEGGFSE